MIWFRAAEAVVAGHAAGTAAASLTADRLGAVLRLTPRIAVNVRRRLEAEASDPEGGFVLRAIRVGSISLLPGFDVAEPAHLQWLMHVEHIRRHRPPLFHLREV